MALDDFDGLLRWEPLQRWVAAHESLPGRGPVTRAERLTGGSQNHLFLLHRDSGCFVLRRPPRHLRANSNETMLREARLLAALAPTAVPHPALYATCADHDVIGVSFYAMEAVDGFTPAQGLPDHYLHDEDRLRAMAFALVDGIAALAAVDPIRIGLSDFGRAEGWLERQVERWRRQLDSYAQLDGYSGGELDGVDEVGRWLDAQRPARWHLGIIHGDCQWANVIYARDRPQLLAFVDWELATLGDPLLDLGSILASWSEASDPPRASSSRIPYASLPTRAELVDRYLERTGRGREPVLWFSVLACYKLGIILEGTWARALAGLAPRATGEMLHQHARWCFARAQQLIHGSH